LFLLALVIFLFPVALYCWALGMVNRREQPLMMPGTWDLVGLLFAASGFLLVIGPGLLEFLYDQATIGELPVVGRTRTGEVLWKILSHHWALLLGYFGVVVAGVLLLLWVRRHKTIVYNVDPAVLEDLLTRSLARLGVPWARQGNRLYLGGAIEPAPAAPLPEKPPGPAVSPATPQVLELQPFAAMYNVTLHWHGTGRALREEVETELARGLAEVRTEGNPASNWLLGAAGCLFALMFFAVLVMILNTFLEPRR
jgi:hypothetical protein